MPGAKRDPAREDRIVMEIVVDPYDEAERALGWYYYLENTLRFPFEARCVGARAISPLRPGEVVTVTGMAPEDECEREMFVQVRWQDRPLAVPLAQLRDRRADPTTHEAIADWHYWVAQGYQF
jgi:Calcium binding